MSHIKTFLSISGSQDKNQQASLTHQGASSRANQSQTLEVRDNNDEPVGDRWDDEEDWGSLEVGRKGLRYVLCINGRLWSRIIIIWNHINWLHVSAKEPEKAQTEPDDWNTDWSGMSSSKKKVRRKMLSIAVIWQSFLLCSFYFL